MVTRNSAREVSVAEHMYGGEGALTKKPIMDPALMYGSSRMFIQGRLEAGSEIGWHIHKGDGEVYVILSGEGEFNDNGTLVTVSAGDVCWTADGEGHSLKALSDELEMIALVAYNK